MRITKITMKKYIEERFTLSIKLIRKPKSSMLYKKKTERSMCRKQNPEIDISNVHEK